MKVRIRKRCLILLITVVSAYLNIAAFGFTYAVGNHAVQIPLVNWLRQPWLYPHDPIISAFQWHASFFWPIVAHLSSWADTQTVLLVFFVLTKGFFFCAIVCFLAKSIEDFRWITCIAFSIALSPFFSEETPFGASDILNSVQTHTSVAIALIIWANFFLLEQRWPAALVLLGLSFYFNALFALYNLFAVAGFAVLDWQEHRRKIVSAGFFMILLTIPWFLFSGGKLPSDFPKDFFATLLLFYPYHLTLQSHPFSDWLLGTGILTATLGIAALAAKSGAPRDRRLEILAGLYFVPVLLGGLVGIFAIPPLLRLQFLRSDALLFLYSILIIQLSGAKIISARRPIPMAVLILGTLAVLAPIFLRRADGLAQVLFLGMSGLQTIQPVPIVTFMLASATARYFGQTWIPGKLVIIGTTAFAVFSGWARLHAACSTHVVRLTAPGFGLLQNGRGYGNTQSRLALGTCAVVLAAGFAHGIPALSRLWNPIIETRPTAAWREVQEWAASNTAPDARFLVPPHPYGFRAFSKRSVWVDWKDGDIVYIFPQYAQEWRRRMEEIGIRLTANEFAPKIQIEQYKRQQCDKLFEVARTRNLSYVVQYSAVRCPARAVFKNDLFAIYSVK